MAQRRRAHWIPPIALGAGQLAHGASWILLLVLAQTQPFALGFPALAWLHLVALGWLTLTALAILVHVIPAFTDAEWHGGEIARAALFVYAAGVVALVTAFWTTSFAALPWAGTLVVAALLVYLVPALRTLVTAFRAPRIEAAIARALTITLSVLFVTAAIGLALAFALAGRAPANVLAGGPQVHAAFGLIGWLTILIMGVSARTIRPISGARSRMRWAHVAGAALELCGVFVVTAGVLTGAASVVWIGLCAIFAGALVYVADIGDILRRATVEHRPPQAFVAAGLVWLLAGLALALLTVAGKPWGAAAAYVVLIGWAGQLVNGHIHHIGVRLIATIARGDDDETQPGELLTTPLSWTSFALFQGAVAIGAVALVAGAPQLLGAAALSGFAGWSILVANVARATKRARRPSPPPDPRATISLLG